MIKVDKGIPIPPKNSSRRGPVREYPWHLMEVGDSFFVEGDAAKRASVASSGSRYGVLHNMKFTNRKEGNGWRIWRIL